MQLDFANGRHTEVATLNGYEVTEAGQHHLSFEKHETFYQLISETI